MTKESNLTFADGFTDNDSIRVIKDNQSRQMTPETFAQAIIPYLVAEGVLTDEFPSIPNDSVDAAQLVDGWDDLHAPLEAGKTTAGAAPSWAAWNGTNIYTWQFDPTGLHAIQISLHFTHDYKPGTNVYPHLHWMPDSADTGVVRWGFEYTIAKGHSQETFNTTTTTVYVEQAAGGQYLHQIAEVVDPGLNLPSVEPDAIILVRIFRDGDHANDTFTGKAHALDFDIHYQVDRLASKNKVPNFYT